MNGWIHIDLSIPEEIKQTSSNLSLYNLKTPFKNTQTQKKKI